MVARLRKRKDVERKGDVGTINQQRPRRKPASCKQKRDSKTGRAAYFKMRREAIKANPAAYEDMKKKERERWKRRVSQGKVPKVAEMTGRQKRIVRKRRRLSAQKNYAKKKQASQEKTPPQTQAPAQCESRQRKLGRKRRKAAERQSILEIQRLQAELAKAKRSAERYRKLNQRLTKKNTGSPRSRVGRFLRNTSVSSAVRRRLIFGEVIKHQLDKAAKNLKSPREKQVYARFIGNRVLKKYRIKTKVGFLPRKIQKWCARPVKSSLEVMREKGKRAEATLKKVYEFFNDDENSIVTPGKKEFVHRGKKEKIRYLTDSLIGLHEKFLAKSDITLSYAQFAKLRPPYVKPPKVTGRDTCACRKYENFKLLVSAVHKEDIVTYKNARELVNSLCCSDKTNMCLARKCAKCSEKLILFNEVDGNSEISYYQWKSEKVPAKLKRKKDVNANEESERPKMQVS